MAYKRHKLGASKSKRIFKKGVNRLHVKNLISGNPMRGGIRL